MTRTLAIAVLATAAASSGCVTTAALARPNRVSLPLLIGAATADLVVTSFATYQIRDASSGGSLATGVAVMAIDVAIGCVLGACSSLRP